MGSCLIAVARDFTRSVFVRQSAAYVLSCFYSKSVQQFRHEKVTDKQTKLLSYIYNISMDYAIQPRSLYLKKSLKVMPSINLVQLLGGVTHLFIAYLVSKVFIEPENDFLLHLVIFLQIIF